MKRSFALLLTLLLTTGCQVAVVSSEVTAQSTQSDAVVEAPKQRVAIVIDDWGYRQDAIPYISQIDRPLTLAILPSLQHTTRIAEIAHAHNHEVILHMPMEPFGEMKLEVDTLMVGMTEPEIQERLERSIASVPHVDGISNHMGSKVTSDREVMTFVFQDLQKRKLFFLDSLTSSDSVVRELAKAHQVPHLVRHIFLDNEMTEEAIQARFDELKQIALERGRAIAIGHDKELTMQMIQRNIEAFEEAGIEFVTVRALIDSKS